MYHAVNQAYRGLAGSDRYCVAFLFVHVDPTKVDVNVHPTKSEVRFVDSGLVHSQILGALREKFLGTDLTVSLPILVQGPGGAEPAGEQQQAGPVEQVNKTDQDDKTDPYSQRLRQAMTDYLSTHKGMGQSGLKFDRSTSLKTSVQDKTAQQGPGQLPHHHADRMAEQSGTQQMPREQLHREVPALQVHNTYLVLESSEGIMIVDQHALHERVIYQQLTTRLAAGAIEQQKLLIPQVVQVTPSQLACLLQITESLAAIGLELQQFSPQAVAVHSFPAMLERLNAQELIEDLLNRLDESALDDRQALLENILQSMACKAAVKAGDPLTPQEIQALLEQSASVDYSASCPHGRPTSLRMTLAELEKRFHRT